jgi:mRNA-decapping enzyme subunit 2
MAATSAELAEVLDDLCMRFLNNLPASEYESFERLFFAVEAANWFYDDFHREENPRLPRLPLRAFAAKIFAHSPVLQPHAADVDALTSSFRTYKHEVPTCGAALLNPDCSKVLLVQAWGKGGKWGFPKGKIAKDETELQAAVREVYEETGYDFSAVLDAGPGAPEPAYVDSYSGGKLSRIFIVPGVPEDTRFETRTRKEIAAITWVPVAALPDPRPRPGDPAGAAAAWPPKSFWLVAPYVPNLSSCIRRRRKRGA